jgi:putative transposase
MIEAVQSVKQDIGIYPACVALNLPRATYYRHLKPELYGPKPASCAHPRAISPEERENVLLILHSERFVDKAPSEIYATLLDEGIYLCSIRSMYRILASCGEVRERRNQLRHPEYKKPELLATGPNQVWSWDITRLRTFVKWSYFYLYVILDIFSRYAVGWMVAHRENAALGQRLIEETIAREDIPEHTLTIHSDRGSPMKAKTTAQLLADMGVTKSYSRPKTSDDNPFSEAHFKTLKYMPEFPGRFGSLVEAREFLTSFFDWYNNEHRHSGIGLMTPASVHYGLAQTMRDKRQEVLNMAYEKQPERFVHGMPKPPPLPDTVWINPPKPEDTNAGKEVNIFIQKVA